MGRNIDILDIKRKQKNRVTGYFRPDAVAYHKSAAALGGLTDTGDIAPLIEFLVTEGRWIFSKITTTKLIIL